MKNTRSVLQGCPNHSLIHSQAGFQRKHFAALLWPQGDAVGNGMTHHLIHWPLIDDIQGEIAVSHDSGSGALNLSLCQHLALFRLTIYDSRPC